MSISNALLNYTPISSIREMGAYEALWINPDASFKAIAECFRKHPGAIPSELVEASLIDEMLQKVTHQLEKAHITDYGVRVNGTGDYPLQLRDAANPLEFFYFRGWWDLVNSPKRIAIVGSRNPSDEGIRRATRLTKLLVKEGFTIVSGLAKGIDTVAHKTAISEGGKTIAVIGTPITEYYPAENKELQEYIAKHFLLISQVPIWRYHLQTYKGNRLFFPERNVTMSALSQATVIVEASNTSGTLTQARAALQQGRKLFILDSCFQKPELTWPARFEKQGAIRVSDFEDIRMHL